MTRPWQIWLGFAAALAVVTLAVAGLSVRALQSDRAQAAARDNASIEENVRLALWRMDSLMAPFVAQESARPAAAYDSPVSNDASVPLDAPRSPDAPGSGAPRRRGPQVPGALVPPARYVLIYFEHDAEGTVSSPQVSRGPARPNAGGDSRAVFGVDRYEARLEKLRQFVDFDELLSSLPALAVPADESPTELGLRPQPPPGDLLADAELRQQVLGTNEFRRRSNYVVQNNSVAQAANADAGAFAHPIDALVATTMSPRVIDGELLLARAFSAGDRSGVQGLWVDWKTLRGDLLAEIGDLLPHAELKLVARSVESDQTRMLAALPLQVEPGQIDRTTAAPTVERALSPVRLSLVVAWSAMLLAALAVAVLLRGVITLSERRADFVSAVTHELRTPLTTFRMYAEMLAEGMVPDESTRKRYLETLRIESDRLTHLVENVLAYARLERGGLGNRIRPVSGAELLGLATGRLSDRAREAGLTLSIATDQNVGRSTVLCDPSAVEQVLFNLVDNACKYAAGSANPAIELAAEISGDRLRLVVRDQGPGISALQRQRLFQPFRKSAEEAAQTAPGVGLGLALSRRLARDMRGELRLDETTTQGAVFVLSLPLQGGPPNES